MEYFFLVANLRYTFAIPEPVLFTNSIVVNVKMAKYRRNITAENYSHSFQSTNHSNKTCNKLQKPFVSTPQRSFFDVKQVYGSF